MFDINQYFENIAVEHVDLQYTKEHPAFFKEHSTNKILFNNSEFLSQMRYVKRNVLVSQFNNSGGWTGKNPGQMHSYTNGAIFIISKCKENEPIDNIRKRCMNIFNDIMARIAHDTENGAIPENIVFDKEIRSVPTGLIADKYYGIMFLMSIDIYEQCTTYKPEKWITSNKQ